MYFTTKEGKPFYIYKPLQITVYSDIDNWEEKFINMEVDEIMDEFDCYMCEIINLKN